MYIRVIGANSNDCLYANKSIKVLEDASEAFEGTWIAKTIPKRPQKPSTGTSKSRLLSALMHENLNKIYPFSFTAAISSKPS
ncbi:hypothetical protein GCM10009410_33910 [Shewanella ulleungensis]|uniref:Uncharacterized protein n=1 Tax=Shewanella ulleungensis TaxID=2282699 RepID=A0ABQ2QW02_9GAMM|nr:hypothetical protein GCM10009410_33910 [Shewanella ulleungensis]